MKKLIKVKYLAPTATKGARVKIIDTLEKNKKIIDYDYSKNSIAEIAIQYLKNKNSLKEGIEELLSNDEVYLSVSTDIKL